MADDVLRMAGLVEGVNYRRQTGVAGGGIPDVTFLLPGDRVLHMDVKFPIDNYVRALEADSEAEAKAAPPPSCATSASGSRRSPPAPTSTRTPRSTTCCPSSPTRASTRSSTSTTPTWSTWPSAQRVVLCSPFTLFAVLAVIRQSMDAFRLERTGDEILTCLGGFTKQWEKFSEQVDKLVAGSFDSTQRAYEDLAGTRRRALQRKLDQVDDLRTRRGDDDLTVVRALRVAGDRGPRRRRRRRHARLRGPLVVARSSSPSTRPAGRIAVLDPVASR